MKNIIEILICAKKKKKYKQAEFEELLKRIKMLDSNLELDWDEGAGEEWARFIDSKHGIVCMLHSQIGIIFVRKTYEYIKIESAIAELEKVFVCDYTSAEWSVDLDDIKTKMPEVYWHASEGAVDITAFSLDDLYYATI